MTLRCVASNSEEKFLTDAEAYSNSKSNIVVIKNKFGFLEDKKVEDKEIILNTGACLCEEDFKKKKKVKPVVKNLKVNREFLVALETKYHKINKSGLI